MDLSQVVVLPTLSLKVAARVVRLTADCQGSDLVLTALLKGKKVIAAQDGFLAPGTKIASGLKEETDKTLAALAAYGAVLCPTSRLAETYQSLWTQGDPPASQTGQSPEEVSSKPQGLSLVTARDITAASQAGQNKVYLVAKGLATAPGQGPGQGVRS